MCLWAMNLQQFQIQSLVRTRLCQPPFGMGFGVGFSVGSGTEFGMGFSVKFGLEFSMGCGMGFGTKCCMGFGIEFCMGLSLRSIQKITSKNEKQGIEKNPIVRCEIFISRSFTNTMEKSSSHVKYFVGWGCVWNQSYKDGFVQISFSRNKSKMVLH